MLNHFYLVLGVLTSFYLCSGHHNPHKDSWPANSSLVTNSRVKIGGFLLGSDLKEKFGDFKPFTSDFKPANADFKIYAGLYYHSNNHWGPEVCIVSKRPDIVKTI